MTKPIIRNLRCAIYTRKSSEEGLDMEFNSLDAQREACEAYIASQKSEGWVATRERYDDGGFSGGTLDRPGLKQLLTDHINPKPNEIAQRFVFYRRDRRAGESVKDYIAQLRKLSEHCNFADKLEEHLRDKFVCGLNDGAAQQKLLATKTLTLQLAIDTSVAMEAAVRSAKQIHGVGFDGQVHRLGQGRYPSNTKLSKNLPHLSQP